LSFYHLQCQRIFSRQRQGVYKHSSFKLRLFNELATVFLVAIVFLVVVKSQSGMLWGLLGLIAFAGIMVLLVYIYKKSRDNDSEQIESGNKQAGESVKKD
jgi:protoporphyrinogen IX oxidase